MSPEAASGGGGTAPSSILIVDGDIIVRHALSDYLRHCGYRVVEAANSDEAMSALGAETLAVDVVLCEIAVSGSLSGFELATWVRQHRPDLEVRLAASVEGAAKAAASLCDIGPTLHRPYDPKNVVDYIVQRRALQRQNSRT